MKIPTLIGIALLLALIGSMVFWFFNREETQRKFNFEIRDLQVVNMADNTVTIVWQTNSPSIGEVYFGESGNLNQKSSDNRDYKKPSERLTHFVTLKNLKPNTRYLYRITNNSISYPEDPLEFKTATINNSDELNFSFLKPLKGTILNTNLNPIDESLIYLEIPGAQNLVTFSSTAGNFILPLKLVLSKDLNKVFNIPPDTQATLTIKKGKLESKVKLSISDSTVNLPPTPIGSNLDLSNYVQPPFTIISVGQGKVGSLDFNGDGIINSLDLAILRGKVGSKTLLGPEEQVKFDINSDGVVDKDDIDIFARSLITS